MDKLLTSIIRPIFALIPSIFLLFSLNACKLAGGNPNWHYTPQSMITANVANELNYLSSANNISPETKKLLYEMVYAGCIKNVETYAVANCFASMPAMTSHSYGHTFID